MDTHRLTITADTGKPDGLVVEGELDAYTAPQLQAALDQAAAGGSDVRLTLSGLGFIDSTGIRVIVRADQALRDRGNHLVIVSPSTSVARLLELTALDQHLVIEGNRAS